MSANGLKPSAFQMLGEEAGVRALVKAFYDVVEQDPEAQALHSLHLKGHGLAHARAEQFDFLCGFLGGPRYYVERHGHSRLREIHAHVPIGPEMRDLWLTCMAKALATLEAPEALRNTLMRNFTRAAEMIRNRPGPEEPDL